MTVQIDYQVNVSNKISNNLIFFVDEQFNLTHLKNKLKISEFNHIYDFIQIRDKEKKILQPSNLRGKT